MSMLPPRSVPLIRHGFCSLHRIGYRLDLDATCPQCVMAGILPPKQYDFDEELQSPVDASGTPVERAKIKLA